MRKENDWTIAIVRKQTQVCDKDWNEILEVLELEMINREYTSLVAIQDDGGRRAIFVEVEDDNEKV